MPESYALALIIFLCISVIICTSVIISYASKTKSSAKKVAEAQAAVDSSVKALADAKAALVAAKALPAATAVEMPSMPYPLIRPNQMLAISDRGHGRGTETFNEIMKILTEHAYLADSGSTIVGPNNDFSRLRAYLKENHSMGTVYGSDIKASIITWHTNLRSKFSVIPEIPDCVWSKSNNPIGNAIGITAFYGCTIRSNHTNLPLVLTVALHGMACVAKCQPDDKMPERVLYYDAPSDYLVNIPSVTPHSAITLNLLIEAIKSPIVRDAMAAAAYKLAPYCKDPCKPLTTPPLV